jgi:hypothetical protein
MTLFILAYMGGALTILAPCILLVVPFVFARVDQPFFRSGLPLLAGMAVTFVAVSTLGAVAGGWAVAANDYGRMAAIVLLSLLSLMGVALLVPSWAERVTRPLVALGSRLSNAATPPTGQGAHRGGVRTSFLLGIATGFPVGAVRWAHSGIDPYRRRTPRSERADFPATARVWHRCRHLARARAAGRKSGVHAHETFNSLVRANTTSRST